MVAGTGRVPCKTTQQDDKPKDYGHSPNDRYLLLRLSRAPTESQRKGRVHLGTCPYLRQRATSPFNRLVKDLDMHNEVHVQNVD